MLSLTVGSTLTLSYTVGAQLCPSFGPADDWGQKYIWEVTFQLHNKIKNLKWVTNLVGE